MRLQISVFHNTIGKRRRKARFVVFGQQVAWGKLIRTAGVMAVVLRAGRVAAGDAVVISLPEGAHVALDRI